MRVGRTEGKEAEDLAALLFPFDRRSAGLRVTLDSPSEVGLWFIISIVIVSCVETAQTLIALTQDVR